MTAVRLNMTRVIPTLTRVRLNMTPVILTLTAVRLSLTAIRLNMTARHVDADGGRFPASSIDTLEGISSLHAAPVPDPR